MGNQIDLILWMDIDQDVHYFNWELGHVIHVAPQVTSAHAAIKGLLEGSHSDYVLFWDPALGKPDSDLVKELITQNFDVWHVGLKLGTSGHPSVLDYTASTWTFIKDPSPEIHAMSWRLSLKACLIRTQVFKELGQIDISFESLDFAALDMGYRFIWGGAMIVHEPRLIPQMPKINIPEPICDSYVFIGRHYQPTWLNYVLIRRIMKSGRFLREFKAFKNARQKLSQIPSIKIPDKGLSRTDNPDFSFSSPRITVLIPTICRYPYLEKTLELIRGQSIQPHEIICVDQTPMSDRQPDLYKKFSDLNLVVIWRDKPGQCSARNVGLERASGDLVLFLDDDVLIGRDYVKHLLEGMGLFEADIVQGVWDQSKGVATIPMDGYYRMSDRFASGNGLATRQILSKIGGFDLNYDRNYRADADLGMRLYLSGAFSIIVPEAKEHSLSPATGGLKFFGASGAISRINLLKPWPSVTQVYYWLRYLRKDQVRNALLVNILSLFIPRNLSDQNSRIEKFEYLIRGLGTFPFRLVGLIRSVILAQKMLALGHQIPQKPVIQPLVQEKM